MTAVCVFKKKLLETVTHNVEEVLRPRTRCAHGSATRMDAACARMRGQGVYRQRKTAGDRTAAWAGNPSPRVTARLATPWLHRWLRTGYVSRVESSNARQERHEVDLHAHGATMTSVTECAHQSLSHACPDDDMALGRVRSRERTRVHRFGIASHATRRAWRRRCTRRERLPGDAHAVIRQASDGRVATRVVHVSRHARV